MKNKIYILVAVIVVIVVVLTLSSGKSNKISIGAVIPQTGFGAYWGAPVLKGIAMAKEDLGKIYGAENVTIKIEDSQSAAPASVSAATKLLNVDKVDVIYTELSGSSSAVSPVVEEKKKAHIYSAYNQKIVEDNPYSVKTFISYDVVCGKLAETLVSTDKVFIVSTIPDAGPYCLKALNKVLPPENIKDIEGFTGTDFRTLLLQNKSFNPDYIIPLMYEDGAFALLKQKGELRIAAKIFVTRWIVRQKRM
ncbi:MAG: ABC transporter substrate-binding protein [Candidatus Taylorbacteria bacterium]|nr:ABC transporter substrate-binding protein [Candidatus Taylorbacteria bacterium]